MINDHRKPIILLLSLVIFCQRVPLPIFAAEKETHNRSSRKCLEEAYLTNTSANYLLGIAGLRIKKYFEPEDKEVVWVGRFILLSNLHAKYKAEWYSPDGKIFEQQVFENLFCNNRYAITSFIIANRIPESLYGKWKVTVFWDHKKIDERYFYIDTKPNLIKYQEEENKNW